MGEKWDLQSNYIANTINLQFCIGFGLNLNWTWIGAATTLHRKRNEIMTWFCDEFLLYKKSFSAFFLSHRHTYCKSACYAWQEGLSPVTLPSQGYVCVIGAWQEKHASVTHNWLILRLCDGVTGKSIKKILAEKKLFCANPTFLHRQPCKLLAHKSL